jgi:hypothetical protein
LGKQIPQTATAPTAALGSVKVTKKIVPSKFNNCGEFMHVAVAVVEPMQEALKAVGSAKAYPATQ